MFNLTYILNNKKYNTSKSDFNVLIEETNINNRNIIKIKAINNIKILNANISYDVDFDKNSKIFLNGYQSWTDTKEAYLNEKEKLSIRGRKLKRFVDNPFSMKTDLLLNKFAFDKYGDVLLYNYNIKKLHGYDILYVKGKNELFSFNYNYSTAFLIYEIIRDKKKLNLISKINNYKLNHDEELTIFDYALYNSYDKGLNAFYELFELKNKKKIFGYTSWYNYYQNINEEIIKRDLKGLDDKFNLFQIDDGYEAYVGDWLNIDKNKFPNGLEEIVTDIHNKGLMAGIWLAPFVAEEKSEIFQNHKDWFKRDINGDLIKCGGNWSGFYTFDLENKYAIEYIKKSLKYYIDLGFDFFKLDFLYAASLPIYENKTRAEVTDFAYKLLRDILKDKLILGCGAIIFPSSKYFDYLRIGPDVSLIFDDIMLMRMAHRERISTKITIQNTIYRSIFDKHLFYNDPDVFLLRDDNIKLSFKQKESLLTINSLFGSVLMTSDNISNYNDKQKELLNYAYNLFYNAKDIKFERNKKYIIVEYKIDNELKRFKYNIDKGELAYE